MAKTPLPVAHVRKLIEFDAEGVRRRKDGSEFFASVIIDPIWDGTTLTGFAKVTRDVTERVKAQQALKETQDQLAASQRIEAIGQLSGGEAHDFNNLLMAIQGKNRPTATS